MSRNIIAIIIFIVPRDAIYFRYVLDVSIAILLLQQKHIAFAKFACAPHPVNVKPRFIYFTFPDLRMIVFFLHLYGSLGQKDLRVELAAPNRMTSFY